MINLECVFQDGNINVKFLKVDEDVRKITIKIYVVLDGEIIAEYMREFPSPINEIHYQKFIQKFLSNPEYRNKYVVSGKWEAVIENKKEIDNQCKQVIEHLNNTKMEDLHFKDFAQLKTNGKDYASSIRVNEIVGKLSEYAINLINHEIDNDELMRLQAYRWCIRGLIVDRAIRKVKVDKEIENNAVKKTTEIIHCPLMNGQQIV